MMRVLKSFLHAMILTLTGLVALLKNVASPAGEDSSDGGASPRPFFSRSTIKIAAISVALFILLLALGGFLVAVSGVIPIKASSRHWAITVWFLNFSMARSVDTHSLSIQPPPLDDPMLVQKGAGHFALGCQPCHGSPLQPNPRITIEMTPHPPYLPPLIHQWDPEELFYIVKHGVKFTGMPAWPSQVRDDEVWAMTAFLLKLPELSAREYLDLTRGETASREQPLLPELAGPEFPRLVLQNCAICHGYDGNGRGFGAYPRLAGQHREYLEASLHAYASGRRHSGIMEPVSAALSTNQIQRIAEYFSSLPASAPEYPERAPALIQRGREIASRGIPERRVPACVECHGPRPKERNPHYPKLAGQYGAYLELQLHLFQNKHRGGTEYSHLMHPTAGRLKADEISAVAAFYENLEARTFTE